ncbi:MAG TPA: hypothetical protein QF468_04785 [Nitrospinota bacterium]|jgi:hypothetical protein|nr:hypothetical protein [Nitrospinota bacterium]|tara:strand:- start:1054 stop:1290 length:237 start_codon:yes stop_codon:yes gene_type:complete
MRGKTVEPDDKNLTYWKELTPDEKKFLEANIPSTWFRNSTPERLEIVEQILKLINDGNRTEAFDLIGVTFASEHRQFR